MAGIEAISLGSASVRNLTASKAVASASADNAKQFENFLKDSNLTQDASDSAEKVESFKTQNAAEANQNASAKEEFSVDAKGAAAGQTDDAATGTKELSPEETEQLAALQEEIRGIVKDTLDMDDAAIDEALQAMGIVLTDLFNPEVLQQFILFVNGGGENTDFLTNEDLMQSFTNLLQLLEDFQAENQDTLLPLMEKLETPVSLEEFLQQEGLDSESFSAVYEGSPEGAVETTVESISGSAVTEEARTGAVVSKTDAESSDMDNRQVIVSSSEKAGDIADEADGFQSAGEDNLSQDNSEMLFSQREDFSGEKTVSTPLFAEQFNILQKDGLQAVNPQWNGTQRMQQMIDIVNQVSEHIRSAVNADTTSVEIQLNPESLGKVFFSVVSKGGVMTANFQVQTEEAKNALESQILILRENLEAKNLKVESVEVYVSDFSFEQSNQAEGQSQEEMAKQSRRKFRYDTEEAEDAEQAEEISAEQIRRQVMRDSGGSIDFTA